MKKRNGFVSNSSSSSFIVAYKSLDSLKEAFKLPDNYPLKNSVDFAECFVDNISETFSTLAEYLESLKKYDNDPDERIIEKLNKGFIVSSGSFSDDTGYAVEDFLCQATLNCDTEDLFIESEGGY